MRSVGVADEVATGNQICEGFAVRDAIGNGYVSGGGSGAANGKTILIIHIATGWDRGRGG